MGKETLKTLAELTERLPPAPKLVDLVMLTTEAVRSYRGTKEIQAVGLWKEPGIAVAYAINEAGGRMDRHQHSIDGEPCHEWLFVIEGELMVTMDDPAGIEEVAVRAGEMIHIPAGRPHTVDYRTFVRLIGISVPADPAFPDPDESYE